MPEPTALPLTALADAAFRQAAAKVILRAQQTGTPIIVWEHDRVRAICAEEALREQPVIEHRRDPERVS